MQSWDPPIQKVAFRYESVSTSMFSTPLLVLIFSFYSSLLAHPAGAINKTEPIITKEYLIDNDTIKVYGANWCGDCFRAKMILDNHQINYLWIAIDHDENTRAFVNRVNDGCIVVPTILFNDGSVLVEPTSLQLRRKSGLETSKPK